MEIMDKNPVKITEKLQFQAPSRQPAPLLFDFFGLEKGEMQCTDCFPLVRHPPFLTD